MTPQLDIKYKYINKLNASPLTLTELDPDRTVRPLLSKVPVPIKVGHGHWSDCD